MSAPFDCAPCRCGELERENQRLRARLDALAQAHREPAPSMILRAEGLDDAAPRPHRFRELEAPPIVVGPTNAQREELRRALDAYDRMSAAGAPLVAHAHALRLAAANAGIAASDRATDWTRLIAASRELVSHAG